MKYILTIIFSFLLVVSGSAQTRNVVVGTNDVIVSPTNFWSANASNGRTGLGLGSAATNPASAFQPSSSVLSNLASSNGVNLTNIPVAGVVGGLATNGDGSGLTNVSATNIVGSSFSLTSTVLSNLSLNNGGSLTNIQASNLIGTISATNIVGISFSNAVQGFVSDVSSATNTVTNSRNVTVYSISPTVNLITNTVQLPTSNAIAGDLARIIHTGPTNSLTRVRKIGETTNLITLNQASEAAGFIYDGTNWSVLPNNSQTFPIYFSGTNASVNAAISRTNLGLGAIWLTNTNVTNFRTAIGLGAEDNPSFADVYAAGFEASGGGTNYTRIVSTGLEFSSAAFAANSRTNLGLGATWLTNTNVTNFRTAIGLGATNDVTFKTIQAEAILFSGDSIIYYDGDDYLQFVENIIAWRPLVFSNNTAATTRTNLGLGWSALTNSNAGTRLVSVDSNGSVVSPTNFWQSAPIASNLQTLVQTFSPATNSTNAATNGRNVYVYSLSTNVSGITNTITLPTNAATIAGDNVTITHQGLTNSITAIRRLGETNDLITINNFDEAVKFIYENGAWAFYHNISFVEPINFSGTNALVNAEASRTNLGLGWGALTNTNASIGLLGYETNGEIFYNRTNLLAFTNVLKMKGAFIGYNIGGYATSGNHAFQVVQTNSLNGTPMAISGGSSLIEFWSDYGSSIPTYGGSIGLARPSESASSNIVISSYGDGFWTKRMEIFNNITNPIVFYSPLIASGSLTATSTVTAKTNLVVEGYVNFTTNYTNATPVTPNTPARWLQIRVGTNVFYLPAHQ